MSKDLKEKVTEDISFRPMRLSDLAEVALLENEIFSDPWPESSFLEIIDETGWNNIVAVSAGRIVGYSSYFIAGAEGHLANIAVSEKFRRKSVAKRMMDTILKDVARAGCDYLLLEVRPSSKEALEFYKKYNFKLLYSQPNYYRRPREDALIMVRYLDEDEELK